MANKSNNLGLAVGGQEWRRVPKKSVGTKPVSFENRFWSLFESGELSDVTLIVGEQKERIKSHKVVLAAASPVLKNYFTDGEMKNEMIISTVEPDVLCPFLKFMYTGDESIEMKNVIPLLNTAKYFQVQKLVTVCENMLKNALTEESALTIFQQAIQYGEKDLQEAAKKTVSRYAHKILETDEFLEIDEECLLKFLSDDDLTVISEVQVFDAMIRWAKAECKRQRVVTTSKYCRSHLEKLIPLIRFPQMDEGDFALKVAHGEIQILTQEELLSVWFFHKIPTERRSEVPSGLFNSRPRRYIDNVTFRIHVKTLNGMNVILDVKPPDTILSIKQKIQPNIGIPWNQQSLTFGGQVLQDGQTLLDCNILKESNLQCLDISNKSIQPNKYTDIGAEKIIVYVWPLNESVLALQVELGTLIEDVKARIQSNFGFESSKQRLIFSGVQLDDGHTLSQYGVQEGSHIHVEAIGHFGQNQNVSVRYLNRHPSSNPYKNHKFT